MITILKPDTTTAIEIPVASSAIRAGFPSPAADYMEEAIDLNKALIHHKATTFLGRVVGDSMKDEGILEGDILVIDKSLELMNDDLAVCFIDGEFTVKRVHIEENEAYLMPSNAEYQPIRVTADNEFMVWGIVTYTIKKNRRRR